MELDSRLNTYKLVVQYKGTAYSGFQIQATDKTIQGELNRSLAILAKTTEVKSIGSGRTDAGVHALGQIVRVEIPVSIPAASLHLAMNSHLPDDIRVLSAESCTSDFHPIYSAKSKEYNYVFSNDLSVSPLVSDLLTHFPQPLNVDAMRAGCKVFCGEHDFLNYQCTGTEIESTVRKIISCDVVRYQASGHWGHLIPQYYVLEVVGNGFLKQMVRLMMGALWNLGLGKISLQDLENSLKENNPLLRRLGPTAPPQGLYLKEVHY